MTDPDNDLLDREADAHDDEPFAEWHARRQREEQARLRKRAKADDARRE